MGYPGAKASLTGGTAPSPDAAAARREALIMAHDELRFDLIHGIHGYANDDQQRGSPEEEVDAQAIEEPARKVRVDEVPGKRQMLQLNSLDHDLRDD